MAQPTQKKKSPYAFLRWLVLLPIPVLWAVLDHYRLIDFFENRTTDWRFYVRDDLPTIFERPDLKAPVKVVYVDIDTKSLEDIGNWPWSRSYFKIVSEALINEGGVRAVGFDILISPTGQSELADQDRQRAGDNELLGYLIPPGGAPPPPVVLAASYAAKGGFLAASDERRVLEQIDAPEKSTLVNLGGVEFRPPGQGWIDTVNGDTRTVYMWTRTNEGELYTMAAELCRLYWGLPRGSIQVSGDYLNFVRPDGTFQAQVPMYNGQLVDINWFSPWISEQNPRISFSTVAAYALEFSDPQGPEFVAKAREFFAQEEFKDAIVLVGPTDPLMQDVSTTPIDGSSRVPRVSVHGNLIKTITSGLYLDRLAPMQRTGIIFGLTLLVSFFAATGGTHGLRSKLAALLLLTAYVYLAFQLFADQQLVLPIVAPLGSVFITSFTAIGWQYMQEERQKDRIKGLFGTYLAPELVKRMAESDEDPQLGGHEEVITAYFSDIQSFSTFSEKMSPARLVELMNEYLTACTDIVQEEGGTLDKYIGDAVVAIFGAPLPLPDHAYRACVATQKVQLRLEELRAKWKSEGDRWPAVVHNLRARLGLNTGPAIIGNMGSRSRFSYTMMGDNVNLAARMESGAKAYGVYTMVTDSTRLDCEKHGGDRLVFRYLDKIVVKGRTLPVPVHEVVGFRDGIDDRTAECLGIYAKAIERYLVQDWKGAEELFQKSATIEPYQPHRMPAVETNPSLVMIERCAYMREHPPGPDWDGRYVMKEK